MALDGICRAFSLAIGCSARQNAFNCTFCRYCITLHCLAFSFVSSADTDAPPRTRTADADVDADFVYSAVQSWRTYDDWYTSQKQSKTVKTAKMTEFHGGCSSRLEFTTGSLTITTDKSRTVSGCSSKPTASENILF